MDEMLEKYKRYTSIKAKLVTTKPVYLVINKNAHSENASAHTLKYTNPEHYAVVFSGGFYRYHKNDSYMIKNIILHELAHIIHPYDHSIGFKRIAELLGTSRKYQNQR
jgi:hypothetical protein